MASPIQTPTEDQVKLSREWRPPVFTKDTCPHLAGSLGLYDYAKTSIVWHEIFVGHPPVGICTICQRQFHDTDPDYTYWREMKSFNLPSASGNYKSGDGADTVHHCPSFPYTCTCPDQAVWIDAGPIESVGDTDPYIDPPWYEKAWLRIKKFGEFVLYSWHHYSPSGG